MAKTPTKTLRLKNTEAASKKAQGQKQASSTRFLLKLFLKWLYIFVSTIGLIFGVYSFLSPKISIEKSETYVHNKPFENPFFVINNGNISVKNFEYLIEDKGIELMRHIKYSGNKVTPKTNRIATIEPGKKYFLSISKSFSCSTKTIISASIEIQYSYNLLFFPFKTFKSSTIFKVFKISETEYVWVDNN